ncbi:LysR family transcriptional regulator substrate-binding protein [Streptomyces sp. NPDC087903]|uniref:LysR family transcriptional regulator substrate-binding protein n=1 Tax=Streptomyces sp. NPDC087903 TaxID=3365819 RepID=UPI0038134912
MRESTAMDEALGLVDSDDVDEAVLTAPSAGRFTITAVAEEEIVPAAPTGHVLAEQSAVRLEDLDGAPLVHFTPDNGLSVWLDQSFARAGVDPETVMRTSVTAAAPQLAAAGLGIAVCPVSVRPPSSPCSDTSEVELVNRRRSAVSPPRGCRTPPVTSQPPAGRPHDSTSSTSVAARGDGLEFVE